MKLDWHRLTAIALPIVFCVSAAAQAQLHGQGRGEQWLRWNEAQRTMYVTGFYDGYEIGFLRACTLADNLFGTDQPVQLGDEHHPSAMPSGRCMARRGEFSRIKLDGSGRLDVTAYTDVLTAFYKKHRSCQEFPVAFLLQSLSSRYATDDELYQLALQGKLEGYETRSREWCTAGN